MRFCTGCERELPLERFAKQKNGPEGHRTRCRDCGRDYARTQTTAYERIGRPSHLMTKYGLTLEAFEDLARGQNYGCAACGDDTSVLHVDHCHSTGVVRGLLCGPCNRALGMLKDDPDRIRGLALYAEVTCSPTLIA